MFVDAVFFPRTVLQCSNVRHNKKGEREGGRETPFPPVFPAHTTNPWPSRPQLSVRVCVRNLYITPSDTAAAASIAYRE